MIRKIILVACILISIQTHAQTFFIKHASVISSSSNKGIEVKSVLIKDGFIQAVGKKLKAPENATIINAKGKYMLPGLWDMHAHLAASTPVGKAPEHYVAHGVLHIRDMGGRLQELLSLRDSIEANKRIGPTIVMAGPTLNGIQPSDFHKKVTTDEEARKAVRELKNSGVDFIKIHRMIKRDVFFAISDECKKIGLPLSGHVPLEVSWAEGSGAGMRTIEHIQTIIENLERDPVKIPHVFDSLIRQLNGSPGESLFTLMKTNNTYFDPTMIGYKVSYARSKPETARLRQAAYEKLKTVVATAHKNGVTMVTGTDVLYNHGDMLLQELFELQSIGMKPMEILNAATENSAAAAGHPELASIEPGAPAAFLILDENPLRDIANLKKIYAIILYKQVLDKAAILKLKSLY